jgi:hypothetical protein
MLITSFMMNETAHAASNASVAQIMTIKLATAEHDALRGSVFGLSGADYSTVRERALASRLKTSRDHTSDPRDNHACMN